MQHIVKKQILEIDLDQKLDSFLMQQEIAGFNQYGVLPVLEKVFDEMSNEDIVTAVDRLEIDLGVITFKEVEEKSLDNLYNKINLQVKEAVIKNTHVTLQRDRYNSKSVSVAQQWLFYMQHGYLNWNTIKIDEDWHRNVLEAFAVDFESVTVLRGLIITHKQALSRIVYQHKEPFLQQLVEILTAEKHTGILSLVNDLANGIEGLRVKTWMLILFASAIQDKEAFPEKLIKKILDKFSKNRIIYESVVTTMSGQEANLEQAIHFILNEEKGISSISADSLEKSITDASPQKLEDGIFVHNAGLVLLHPFLNSFFKKLKMVNEAAFINSSECQKALYLLNFMATGSVQAEEHELFIPKLLCAFSLYEPVSKDIELSEQEMKEVINLLEAAIAQWDILKNTSPTGLREGFLQRNGKLYSKNDNLYLQVETSSIDIVMDYLPWNLSMIKLPWMKEILRVEWR